jgi:hypothetical protein
VAFYTAVHLVNAHLAKQINQHYRTHKKVDDAISPYSSIESVRLDDDTYASYLAIKNLSRRARYMCSDDGSREEEALLTHDKHYQKALHHLDVLLTWFTAKYPAEIFEQIAIACPALKKDSAHFRKI